MQAVVCLGTRGEGDYHSCLSIVNEVLSCIPPYALYCNKDVDDDANTLHLDKYFESNIPIYRRARSAWLFDLYFRGQNIIDDLPLAVKVELRFCDDMYGVKISPFTCAYYLMFLSYHELGQYEERDNALRLLIDTMDSFEQLENRGYHLFSIAGHCLLLAGHTFHACVMFVRSYLLTQKINHLTNTTPQYTTYRVYPGQSWQLSRHLAFLSGKSKSTPKVS